MFKLSVIAIILIASTGANAAVHQGAYQAPANHGLSSASLKAQQRDISDLYFVHFNNAPLAQMAKSLRQVGIQSMYAHDGRLNIQATSSQSYLSQLQQQRQNARKQLSKNLGRSLLFERQYDTVLNAVTVRLSQAEADKLAANPLVSLVDKVTIHQLHTDSGPDFIGADQIWDGLDSELPTKGEGVIVGIIDTGIDADHPSFTAKASDGYSHINPLGEGNYLGDCGPQPWLCNAKLIGVVSYPELRDYYPSETVPGFDRAEIIETGWDMQGHGTHVASTVAGNPLSNLPMFNINGDLAQFSMAQMSGVAPRANIVSYQVCLPAIDGQDSGCFPDLTIEALEHAIANGVNVINYSVGGDATNPWLSSDSMAFLNARIAGIHVATSAGNAGPEATTIGAPANSPWITTVAAYTHDRSYSDKQLNDFSGGDSTPTAMTGKGATLAYTGSVVDAADYGDGDCLNPFSAGTFSGEIVVCRRGDIGRLEKGANVLAGGAGGLVLVNVSEDANNLVADLYSLPAIQLNISDGQKLLDWLRSGSGHQATISAAASIKDPALGDVAGDFSSRGPNAPYAELLAPDVAAPGVDIFAGHTTEFPYSTAAAPEYAFMSGTSMSSPHVAGALALLHAMRPDWSPAQAQSALMTTATTNTFTDDDYDGVLIPSTPYDAGMGRIQIAQAVKAGLLLDIAEQDYLDANPDEGGDPTALNLPSMVAMACVNSCSWTRTVTAAAAASWTTQMGYDMSGFDMTVVPSSFSLAAGQSQQLTITATANDELTSSLTHGRIQLMADGLPTQHLTAVVEFSAGSVPVSDPDSRGPVILAESDQGSYTLDGFQTNGSDNLQFELFGLNKIHQVSAVTTGDVDVSNPVDDSANVHVEPITVYANTRALTAWIVNAQAPDLDLYIARDADLNGQISFIELSNSICVSGRVDSQESCVVEDPAPGNYLVVVHNFAGTAVDALDSHTIAFGVLTDHQANFEVVAPSSVGMGEAFSVDINWDQPMAAGDIYYGAFSMGTAPETPDNVGTVQFELHRANALIELAVSVAEAVAGDIISYSLTVAANTSSSARQLVITTELPEGVEVSNAADAQVNGNMVSWIITQAAHASASELSLHLDSSGISNDTELSLGFDYSVDGGAGQRMETEPVQVLVPATAMINGLNEVAITVGSPATISLSGAASIGDSLTYQWTQLSGPTLAFTGVDMATVNVTVPAQSSDTTAHIELVVTGSNGLASEPAVATLNLQAAPEDSSGGSSSGSLSRWILLLLAAATLFRRR
ncbi:S8 family serine peptidase [Ferrimonas lipolytica]|uniref:S8 family serine peptidase n=1 Tax=Ferrimonas lipolytica TaxID=2724191 RepID=A0A6H1UFW6_9GAMM|nr:S8 family serine peptidase [Ferrimonas lipolytica]QIZ77213.1 S8 family serine peptidase [Ferrimonas lipolytica]